MAPKRKNKNGGGGPAKKAKGKSSKKTEIPFEDPCQYLRDQLASNEDDIQRLRQANWPPAQDRWTARAQRLVSQVILAINEIQPHDKNSNKNCQATRTVGFSALGRLQDNTVELVRPGRPFIFPQEYRALGWILVIAQFDENGNVSLHVLDPTEDAFNEHNRAAVRDRASETLDNSNWQRLVSGTLADDAEWVPIPSDSGREVQFCYVILSAWALAMGLQLNPDFNPDDTQTQTFVDEAIDIFMLSDSEAFNWELLLAFFRCHQFVMPDSIPAADRQFQQIDYAAILQSQLREDEVLVDLQRKGKKRVKGQPYKNVTGAQLGKKVKVVIPEPARCVRPPRPTEVLPPRPTTVQEIYELLEVNVPDSDDEPEADEDEYDIFQRFQETCRVSTPEQLAVINNDPCVYAQSKLTQYTDLTSQQPPNGLQPPHALHIASGQGREQDYNYINLAIASVVEALMAHQVYPAFGGFALTAEDEEGRQIARPRRIWIKPYTVDETSTKELSQEEGSIGLTDSETHAIIDVVQEETQETGRPSFKHHIIDSRPNIIASNYGEVISAVEQEADAFGWTSHRNDDDHVWFTHRFFRVEQAIEDRFESHNRWEAGMLAVLNAWIVALGLTVNPNARERDEDEFYERGMILIQRAVEGVVDWSTIVAFLKCYDLILEEGLHRVNANRQFSSTQVQTDNSDLIQRLDNYHRRDEIVAKDFADDQEFLYDLSNNVNFGEPLRTVAIKTPRILSSPHVSPSAKDKAAAVEELEKTESGEEISEPPALLHDVLPRRPSTLGEMVNMLEQIEGEGSQEGKSSLAIFRDYQDSFAISTNEEFKLIDRQPCTYVRQRLRQFQALTAEPSSHTRREKAQANLYDPQAAVVKVGEGAVQDELNVSLAIASVIEAIMIHQDDQTALGGFALARIQQPGAPIARPRRPWIVPYFHRIHSVDEEGNVVDNDEDSHIILMILQEEEVDGERAFVRHIIDSRPGALNRNYENILRRVADDAEANQWSSVRNTQNIDFAQAYYIEAAIPDPFESHDRFESGMLAVFHAWIIALRLTVNSETVQRPSQQLYEEGWNLIRFALAGVVDWTTIAAFLICHELTEERTLEWVPEARRFNWTQLQTTAADLNSRIAAWQASDIAFENTHPDEGTEPYDYSNNIAFENLGRKTAQLRDAPKPSPEQDPCQYLRAQLEKRNLRRMILNARNTSQDQEELLLTPNRLISILVLGINHHQQGFGATEDTELASLSALQLSNPDSMPVIRPRRPLLVARTMNGVGYLQIAQFDNDGDISICYLVSRNQKLTQAFRQEALQRTINSLQNEIGWMASTSSKDLPNEATWVEVFTQQDKVEIMNLYIILAAWALALGLRLDPSFDYRSNRSEEFLRITEDLCYLILTPEMNWRIIYAFLRCYGFATGDVPEDRRFETTFGAEVFMAEQIELDAQADILQGRAIAERIQVAIPTGFRIRRNTVDSDTSRFSIQMPSFPSSPTAPDENFDIATVDRFWACQYLHESLSRKRSQERPDAEDWLEDNYTFYGIYSVVHAINRHVESTRNQGGKIANGTWAVLKRRSISLATGSSPQEKNVPVIYPNDPLIIPWTPRSTGHSFLVIVQNEDVKGVKGRYGTSIKVLDSGPWLSTRPSREQLLRQVQTLLEQTQWDVSSRNNRNIGTPGIQWISTTPQRDTWQSRYYTVINAWVILLDARLNNSFQPRQDFFQTARDVIYLALVGQADWVLIWTFMICTGYILPPIPGTSGSYNQRVVPPETRRFRSTVSYDDQIARFKSQRSQSLPDRQKAPGYYDFSSYKQFQHSAVFPSDDWQESDRNLRRMCLQRWKMFKPSISRAQLRQRLYDKKDPTRSTGPWNRDISLSGVRTILGDRGENAENRPEDTLYREFFRSLRVSTRYPMMAINSVICEHWDRSLNRMEMCKYPRLGRRYFNERDDAGIRLEDVVLAISAVVEAITTHQNDQSALGGFALASFSTLEGDKTPTGFCCARPRRAWLMPCTVTSDDIQRYRTSAAAGGPGSEARVDHTILIIYQEEDHIFRRYIIDSEPQIIQDYYSLVVQDADGIARNLGWHAHRNEDEIPFKNFQSAETDDGSSDVIHSVRQSGAGTAGIHVILNAWACALGLTPQSAEDNPEHFTNYNAARRLVHVALGGIADWTTIAAFLICHNLVKEKRVQRVPEDKRFPHTHIQTDSAAQQGRIAKLILEDNRVAELFPSDTRDPYDFRNNVHFGPTQRQVDDFEDDFTNVEDETSPDVAADPCSYYRSRVDSIEKQKLSQDWLKAAEGVVPHQDRDWFDTEQVSLSIASVTMAITKAQSMEGGFSILEDWQVAQFSQANSPGALSIDSAIRFGRPILLPIAEANHIILLVVQLDQKHQIQVAVVDSRGWHLNFEERGNVYEVATNILRASEWYRRLFSIAEIEHEIPATITWIRGPRQPDADSCGYIVILNAWTLALGLQLNTEVVLKPKFHEETRNIVRLARGGLLSYDVIVAFLHCQGWISGKTSVPRHRRFQSSVEFKTSGDLHSCLEEMRDDEEGHWMSFSDPDYGELGDWSRVRLPEGIPHNRKFESDSWGNDIRMEIIPSLIEDGMFNPAHQTANELRRDFADFSRKQSGKKIGTQTPGVQKTGTQKPGTRKPDTQTPGAQKPNARTRVADFRKRIANNLTTNQTLNLWHEHFNQQFPETSEEYQKRIDLINKSPCEFARDQMDVMAETYKSFPRIFTKHTKIPKLTRYLEAEELNLLMVAVIEAIDLHQRPTRPTDLMTGGLTCTTSFGIDLARSEHGSEGVGENALARPRRCWLMPYVVDEYAMAEVEKARKAMNDTEESAAVHGTLPGGHIFLAVVQEQDIKPPPTNGPTTEFRVYFVDSSPGYFADVRGIFYQKIQDAARNLGWSTHRNPNTPSQVCFAGEFWTAEVPEQTNNWGCGYHTVVNAWILAMGLTINGEADYKKELYPEARDMAIYAICGFVDWQTLFAWLRCHDLITEESPDQVPENRRFVRTIFQIDDNALGARIETEHRTRDNPLRMVSESLFPYERNNTTLEDGDESEESSVVGEDVDTEGYNQEFEEPLRRSYDDEDMEWELTTRVYPNRKRKRGTLYGAGEGRLGLYVR